MTDAPKAHGPIRAESLREYRPVHVYRPTRESVCETCGRSKSAATHTETHAEADRLNDSLAPWRETTSDGSLPAYAWPGGYPLFYLTNDGLVVCSKCANDPDTSDPVVFADINWEDGNLFCDDKGERIESAYAEDDDRPEYRLADEIVDINGGAASDYEWFGDGRD